MSEKLSCVIVGAGHRGLLYASYALEHPDELGVVGVADPLEQRRKAAAEMFGFSQEHYYESAEALAGPGKIADFAINGTMDHQHLETPIPLLEAGYDMLLEKPLIHSWPCRGPRILRSG
jgi:predicted dehydrogenase